MTSSKKGEVENMETKKYNSGFFDKIERFGQKNATKIWMNANDS